MCCVVIRLCINVLALIQLLLKLLKYCVAENQLDTFPITSRKLPTCCKLVSDMAFCLDKMSSTSPQQVVVMEFGK